jgi:hypothetical protein
MTLSLNVNGVHILYIHLSTVPLVMKSTPFILVSLALFSLCGTVSAQTTPSTPSKPTKGTHPIGKPAPRRTASPLAYKMDTAAFRRSGRPADRVPIRVPVKKLN